MKFVWILSLSIFLSISSVAWGARDKILVTGSVATLDSTEMLRVVALEMQRRVEDWNDFIGFEEVLVSLKSVPRQGTLDEWNFNSIREELTWVDSEEVRNIHSQIGLIIKTDAHSCNEVDWTTSLRIPTLALSHFGKLDTEPCFFPWIQFNPIGFMAEPPLFLIDKNASSNSIVFKSLKMSKVEKTALSLRHALSDLYQKVPRRSAELEHTDRIARFEERILKFLESNGATYKEVFYVSGTLEKQVAFIEGQALAKEAAGRTLFFFVTQDPLGQSLCDPRQYLPLYEQLQSQVSEIRVVYNKMSQSPVITNSLGRETGRGQPEWREIQILCGEFTSAEKRLILLKSGLQAMVSGYQELQDAVIAGKTHVTHDSLSNPESKEFKLVPWLNKLYEIELKARGNQRNGGYPTVGYKQYLKNGVAMDKVFQPWGSHRLVQSSALDALFSPESLLRHASFINLADDFERLDKVPLVIDNRSYFIRGSGFLDQTFLKLVTDYPVAQKVLGTWECRRTTPYTYSNPQQLCRTKNLRWFKSLE